MRHLLQMIPALAMLLLPVVTHAAGAPDSAPQDTPQAQAELDARGVRPLLGNLWQSRPAVTWKLDRGGCWASLGHSATVVAILPDGGPKQATQVRVLVYRVEEFDARTRAPVRVTLLIDKTFGFADFADRKGGVITHNLHVPGKTFRYCLMMQLRGAAAGRALAEAQARIAVIEYLEDPAAPKISKWIEPTHPASADWYARESVKAPWKDGAPLAGTFRLDDKTPVFGPAAARTIDPVEQPIGPKTPDTREEVPDAAVELEER